MEPSDEDLIGRIRERSAEAFEALFARHRQKLLKHLLRTVRDDAGAEDLVQELFLRVWTRAEQWKGRGSVEAWLFRIATNLALNYVRTVRRRRQRALEAPAVSAEEEDESPVPGWMIDAAALGPEALAEQAERQERLHRLVDDLPEEKREVLRLIYEAELDIAGAADVLGIPEGTVKSRLHSARKRLARKWGDKEGR
jgi:RNA polymerase sigma-70 factor (ECF subfamily)